MNNSRKNNSRNVWSFGSASFLNDVGGEMIAPLLPFYIQSLGGAGIALGLVSGLREGLSSIFKILGGYFSDRIGKRTIFIFFGYLISTVFKFLIGIATSWQHLIAFVSLERFGKFRDAPRDAVISYSGKTNGKNFGIVQMMDVLGGIFGMILLLFLFNKFSLNFRSLIFIAAGISALSLIPLFFVKEPKIKAIRKTISYGIKHLNPRLKYFVFVSSFFAFANFGLYMFLLLMAQELTKNFTASILLYILFNATYAIFLVPFGIMSDKLGRKKIIFLGYFLFVIVALGFIFADKLIYLAILFAIYGLVYATTHASQRALVSDLSGKMKGTAFGFFHMTTGLAGIPGGIIAGALWNLDSRLMFSYLSVLGFISIILLLFVREK